MELLEFLEFSQSGTTAFIVVILMIVSLCAMLIHLAEYPWGGKSSMPGTVVYLLVIPDCQDPFNAHRAKPKPASYDAKLPRYGHGTTWAYVCEECFARGGGKLGVGLGQEIKLKEPI